MERFWKVHRNLSNQAPFHESEKNGLQLVCLTNIEMTDMVSFKRISKEAETSQWVIERDMQNVKRKDRIRNTIIVQRTWVSDTWIHNQH